MDHRNKVSFVWCLLLLTGSLALTAKGWSQTGEIRVDTSDQSGVDLAGVSIVIAGVDQGAVSSFITDSAGLAVAAALLPGRYKVSAALNGFGPQEQIVPLTVGQVAQVRFTLKPAVATQTVVVRQNAGLEIETANVNISSVVERQQLDQLPVINRGFIGLAQLLPGGAPSLTTDARFGIQTTLGGANVRSGYSVLIDGSDVDHPIYGLAIVDVDQDAVQEFRVMHNQYDAEYGRAGTAVVDVVTRSGTNAYAGMISYFGQNQALNARNYFVPAAPPPFGETLTSATLGGPIVKDKTHFFASDEFLKQTNSYVEALPASNPFASSVNGIYPGSIDEKLVQAKLYHQPNGVNNYSLRYLFEDQTVRSAYPLEENSNIVFHDGILQWAHTLSASMVNNAQLDYMDQNTFLYETAAGPEIIRPSFTSGSPTNLPQGYPRRRVGFNDTFFWTKGRNAVKTGTRMAYEHLYQEGDWYGAGVWTFNTNNPFVAADSSTYPIAYTVGSGPSTVEFKHAELSYFLQDDIKITPRLTFNTGARYDVETNLRDNRYVNELLANPEFPDLNTFVSRSRGNYLDGIQPRLGLAYDLRGNGQTVIRAGFGGAAARNRPFFDTQMEAQEKSFDVTITNPALLANYPSQTAVLGGLTIQQYIQLDGGRAMYLVGNQLNIPYVYDFSLGVEKALFRNTVLTLDGIRQIQTYLQSGRDENLPVVGPLSTHPRPFPQYAAVTVFNGTTSAYYTALDAQLKSQFRKAFVLASYTWSKSISDGLDDNTSYTTDPFHEYGNNDRGFDEEDRRNGLSLSPLVELPYGFQFSGIVSLLTGPPWNITYGKDFDGDGITQDRPAGLSKDIGGRARASDLAIVNAARTSTVSTTLPSGLVIPALSAANCSSTGSCLGTVTLGQLNQSDGQEKIDLRLTKGFNFTEGYRLELFMEGYDILNTPSFLSPNGVISSPDFLERSAANNPRQLQWGVRFNFNAR